VQFGRPSINFLLSLGFKFKEQKRGASFPKGFTLENLQKRHYRIKCREDVGNAEFGPIFEHLVQQLLLSQFRFDVLSGVQIEDEGSGGDYDVLAFQAPHLHYIECKSGAKTGFENILKRHYFLRPALTLVLIDQTLQKTKTLIEGEISDALTKSAFERYPDLKKRKPHFRETAKLISDPGRSFSIYHTTRNVFIACPMDHLDETIRRVLRHFHQVVLQSSYYS